MEAYHPRILTNTRFCARPLAYSWLYSRTVWVKYNPRSRLCAVLVGLTPNKSACYSIQSSRTRSPLAPPVICLADHGRCNASIDVRERQLLHPIQNLMPRARERQKPRKTVIQSQRRAGKFDLREGVFPDVPAYHRFGNRLAQVRSQRHAMTGVSQ